MKARIRLQKDCIISPIDPRVFGSFIEQLGRAAEALFPVKDGPFYACTFDPVLGETMVTMGGSITDGEQNAVDANYEPIPVLYLAGYDCGRRCGTEYATAIPGCSLAFALVLGRECGKSVAKFLG